MYQEATLMYGYSFTDEKIVLGPALTEIFEGENTGRNTALMGFHDPYCGYPEYTPRAFGAAMSYWDETDEDDEEYEGGYSNFGEEDYDPELFGITSKKELKKYEEEAKKEYAELWEKLPEDLKQEISAFGEPNFFVLWGTS